MAQSCPLPAIHHPQLEPRTHNRPSGLFSNLPRSKLRRHLPIRWILDMSPRLVIRITVSASHPPSSTFTATSFHYRTRRKPIFNTLHLYRTQLQPFNPSLFGAFIFLSTKILLTRIRFYGYTKWLSIIGYPNVLCRYNSTNQLWTCHTKSETCAKIPEEIFSIVYRSYLEQQQRRVGGF